MWRRLLQFGLLGLGLSAILIGCGLSIFGPEKVANFFNHNFRLVGAGGEITDLATVNIESELRFFGMMFAFYGASLIWILRDYLNRFHLIPYLLLVFFLSGLGRLIGFVRVGEPHLLFQILMYIELGLPVLLMVFWLFDKRLATNKRRF